MFNNNNTCSNQRSVCLDRSSGLADAAADADADDDDDDDDGEDGESECNSQLGAYRHCWLLLSISFFLCRFALVYL